MSGKQNSEDVPVVCAFGFVGSFAFALLFSPFIALRTTFSTSSRSFSLCSLSSFTSSLPPITTTLVRFLRLARGACLPT